MKTGGISNTATIRQSSADAVGCLGVLGKYTDGLRATDRSLAVSGRNLAVSILGWETVSQTLFVNGGSVMTGDGQDSH